MEGGHLGYGVDDDPVIAALIEKIIRSRGDRARIFTNAEDALLAFKEEEPCYGILDQQLPMNRDDDTALPSSGEWLLTRAREVNPRWHGFWHVMPLLVLTGYMTDTDYAVERAQLGADAFIA